MLSRTQMEVAGPLEAPSDLTAVIPHCGDNLQLRREVWGQLRLYGAKLLQPAARELHGPRTALSGAQHNS